MKKQIKRFSPHQNAKVLSILMAITSFVFVVPMVLIMAVTFSNTDQVGLSVGPPFGMILLLPILYLVLTYFLVLLVTIIYNFITKFVGGFEYENEEQGV